MNVIYVKLHVEMKNFKKNEISNLFFTVTLDDLNTLGRNCSAQSWAYLMENPICLKCFRCFSRRLVHICPPQNRFLAMKKHQTLVFKKKSDFTWKFESMARCFVTIFLLPPENKRAWSFTSSNGPLIRIATQETCHPN